MEYLFIFPALISHYYDWQQFYLTSNFSFCKIRQVDQCRKMEINPKKSFPDVHFINQQRGYRYYEM